MIQLRLWAYKIATIEGEINNNHFKAIEICENTAQLLAKQFNGRADCSTCGCVQYSDTVILDKLSEQDEELIKKCYSFVTVRRPFIFN